MTTTETATSYVIRAEAILDNPNDLTQMARAVGYLFAAVRHDLQLVNANLERLGDELAQIRKQKTTAP